MSLTCVCIFFLGSSIYFFSLLVSLVLVLAYSLFLFLFVCYKQFQITRSHLSHYLCDIFFSNALLFILENPMVFFYIYIILSFSALLILVFFFKTNLNEWITHRKDNNKLYLQTRWRCTVSVVFSPFFQKSVYIPSKL